MLKTNLLTHQQTTVDALLKLKENDLIRNKTIKSICYTSLENIKKNLIGYVEERKKYEHLINL